MLFPFPGAAWKLRRALCAGLTAALLFCAGCGQQPAVTPGGSVSSSAGGAEAFAPSSQESPEQERPSWKPASQITAISPASVPTFAGLDERRAYSCWTDFSETEEPGTTYLVIIDLARDRVERSSAMDGYASLERSFSDGTALLLSYEQDCFYLLDQQLRRTRLEVPNTGGQFSHDHSRYYYVQDDLLYGLDLSTGERELIPVQRGMRLLGIDGIHPSRDYLFLRICPSLYSMDLWNAMIDCESGEFLMFQEGVNNPSCFDDHFMARRYDYGTGSSQLIWGGLSGGAALECAEITDLETQYSGLQLLDRSVYALRTFDPSWGEYWEEGNGPEPPVSRGTDLYRLTGEGVYVCPLADYGVEEALLQAVYLPESGLILGSSYQDETCAVTLIDPGQLDFAAAELPRTDGPELIDRASLDAFLSELELPPLPPALESAQTRAEELERRYDIHILLSGQCAGPCSASNYQVTTTDQAGWSDEAAVILQALNDLETVLSSYPEGYFSQFRSESEDSGVYFMPVSSIDSEGQDNVAAFEFGSGTQEYIAFDISLYGLTSNLYHEIWHATENKIGRTDYAGFYGGGWDACNPEGFEYLYSYDTYSAEENLWQWTYFGSDGEVYFVDDYSRTFPHEDRARIMEYIMGDDQVAEDLLSSPAIREKFRLMRDGIRAAFDTSGWTDVHWERFS